MIVPDVVVDLLNALAVKYSRLDDKGAGKYSRGGGGVCQGTRLCGSGGGGDVWRCVEAVCAC